MDNKRLKIARDARSFMLSFYLLTDEIEETNNKDLIELSEFVKKEAQAYFFSNDIEFLTRKRNALNRQIAILKKAELDKKEIECPKCGASHSMSLETSNKGWDCSHCDCRIQPNLN